MVEEFEYCVSSTISIAMHIPSWGYDIHGHDIRVEACVLSSRRVDIELLRDILNNILEKYDHKPLWKTVGENALVEDLLEKISLNLNDIIISRKLDLRVARITGYLPNGSISIVYKNT